MNQLPGRHEVMLPYRALVSDVERWAPDLVHYFLSANDRLEELVSTRGTTVVLIDLPKFGKAFDKSLSGGYLVGLPPSLGSWAKGSYLFQDLLNSLGYDAGRKSQNLLNPTTVFLIRTYLYLMKEAVEEAPDEAIKNSIHTWFRLDEGLRRPTLRWSSSSLGSDGDVVALRFAAPRVPSESWTGRLSQPDLFADEVHPMAPNELLSLLDAVVDRVVGSFPLMDPDEVTGQHGPGAVADVKRGEDKYTFPHWPEKLGLTFPYEQHAQTRADIHLERDKPYSLSEIPARLKAVFKDYEKGRVITIESIAHQFLQQGSMRWVRKNLPYLLQLCIGTCVDQAPSRERVLRSSASEDGDATVDLVSASDLLSCWVVERIFRPNPSLLRALHACRSRWAYDRESGQGTVLRKYAGQGNATTFVVQSICYAIFSITSVLWMEGIRADTLCKRHIAKASRRVRVFGDDIIIPSSSGLILEVLLQHMQLKVNGLKTHTSGYFRESCGMDAYRGEDVTPHYMSAMVLRQGPKPEELASWISVSNNAFEKGLWALAGWMDECLPQSMRGVLAVSDRPVTGLCLRTYVQGVQARRNRWNKEFHCLEYRLLTLQTDTTRAERRDGFDDLLQYYTERPSPHTLDGAWPVPSSNSELGFVEDTRTVLKVQWVPVS